MCIRIIFIWWKTHLSFNNVKDVPMGWWATRPNLNLTKTNDLEGIVYYLSKIRWPQNPNTCSFWLVQADIKSDQNQSSCLVHPPTVASLLQKKNKEREETQGDAKLLQIPFQTLSTNISETLVKKLRSNGSDILSACSYWFCF